MREERKVVTALFGDLAGSTALAERLDPEDYREVLGGAITAMVTAIEAFGGTIKDLAGDGVLALFGAPVAHEDDQERAVLAGLRIVEVMADYGQDVAHLWGDRLLVRVGIETGLVVLGPVGASSRVEYGAVGDAVITAFRLQARAAPQTVLVGEAARKGIEMVFDWGPEQELAVKGKALPVLARPALAFRPVRRASRGVPITPRLAGRQAELSRLEAVIDNLHHGCGALVFVTGDAGVGKSRLLAETKSLIEQSRPSSRWLEGRCLSYGSATPFLPFRELLLDWLDESASALDRSVQEAIHHHATGLFGGDAHQVAPLLAAVLGLPWESEGSDLLQLPPDELQSRIFAALGDTLRRLAEQAPTIVVIEDLHWADPTSVQLLERLLPLAQTSPLLLLVTMRQEREALGWQLKEANAALSSTAEVVLSPLGASSARELLYALVGADVLPAELEAAVLSAGEGNPFYIEEVVRSMRDAGALVDTDAGWRYDPTRAVEVPATVERVILSRTDRLASACHGVLSAASVIGRRFTLPVLAALSEADGLNRSALDELSHLDLVRQVDGDGSYEFKHALIQETVYRSLLKRRRRELHARVAAALESLFPHRGDELAGELGRHFAGAEMPDQAVRYLGRAADLARRAYANEEAISLYRGALGQVAKLTSAESSAAEVTAALAEGLGEVLLLVTRYDAAEAAFRQALDSLPADRPRQARLHRLIAEVCSAQGEYDRARSALLEAESALRADDDEPGALWWEAWLDVHFVLANIAYLRGNLREHGDIVERVRPKLVEHGNDLQRADFYWTTVNFANRQNRFVVTDATLLDARAGFAATVASGTPRDIAWAQFQLGFSLLWHGDTKEAADQMEPALAFAEASGDTSLQSHCLTYIVVAVRMLGQVERLGTLCERSETAARAAELPEYVAMTLANRGWLAWKEGRFKEVEDLGREALDLWQSVPARYPFDWMAAWPLIATSLTEQRTGVAFEFAPLLLKPSQQPQPEPVATELREACQLWGDGEQVTAARRLASAVQLAQHYRLL